MIATRVGERSVTEFSFDLGAASWRHTHADERAYVEALAERLAHALPDLTQIKREHKLFAKEQKLKELAVSIADESFILTLEGNRYVSRVAKTVRGIILARKDVEMQEWLQQLSRALGDFARSNQERQASLQKFLL